MKRNSRTPSTLFALTLLVPLGTASAQESPPETREQRLEHVPPPSIADADPRTKRAFDAEAWLGQLEDTDLDRREASYDALVLRARFDPVARLFLERLARDDERPDLAWTARLAVRELALRQLGGPSAGFSRLDVSSGVFMRQLEELYAMMLEERPGLPFALPQKQRSTRPGPPTAPTEPPSLEELFSRGERSTVRTDVLGVYVRHLAPAEAKSRGLTYGLRVTRLEAGTIADAMGVRVGDVLLELNGTSLTSGEDVTRVMGSRTRSQPVTLLFVDDLDERVRTTWTPDPEPTD